VKTKDKYFVYDRENNDVTTFDTKADVIKWFKSLDWECSDPTDAAMVIKGVELSIKTEREFTIGEAK
jgi:hypothetical protein